nr:high mobility group B protein 6-like isoform X1 [Ipomoea trifida]
MHVTRGASKAKEQVEESSSFEKELQEIQDRLQRLKIEKELTEELLKAREEMLKQKEEELEVQGKEQEKLQLELKKLQKIKEFKPTVALVSCFNSLILHLKQLPNSEIPGRERKREERQEKVGSTLSVMVQRPVKKANPDAEFKEITNQLGD